MNRLLVVIVLVLAGCGQQGPPQENPAIFANVSAFCGSDHLPLISLTMGTRPDLNGDVGILDFSDRTSYGQLVFLSGRTVTFPYPFSLTTPLGLTYRIQGETATATVTLPPDCPPGTTTTTTTTSIPTTSTTVGATTIPSTAPTTTTSTSAPTSTTSTVPSSSSTLPRTG